MATGSVCFYVEQGLALYLTCIFSQEQGWEFIKFYCYQCHYRACLSARFFTDSWSIFWVQKSRTTKVFHINTHTLLLYYLWVETQCGWDERVFVQHLFFIQAFLVKERNCSACLRGTNVVLRGYLPLVGKQRNIQYSSVRFMAFLMFKLTLHRQTFRLIAGVCSLTWNDNSTDSTSSTVVKLSFGAFPILRHDSFMLQVSSTLDTWLCRHCFAVRKTCQHR